MNVIKYLNGKNGLDSHKLLSIYRTLIRSKLDYGSQVYGTASSTLLKNLDTVHNSCLRLCSGSFRSTRSTSLCSYMGEPPLSYRRLMLSSNLNIQLLNSPPHPTNHLLQNPHIKQIFKLKSKNKELHLSLRLKENGIPSTLQPPHHGLHRPSSMASRNSYHPITAFLTQ